MVLTKTAAIKPVFDINQFKARVDSGIPEALEERYFVAPAAEFVLRGFEKEREAAEGLVVYDAPERVGSD